MSFRQWVLLREGVIKTPVPKKSQEFTFSCGASALRSVLHYFNINKTEEEIRKIAKTNKQYGTTTKNLIKAAKYFGLKAKQQYNMREDELKSYLDEKKPVIVCFQAWGDKKYYKTKESGHYAVVIGYDENKVYFQDPLIKEKIRGHLSWEKFIKRWHDVGNHDRYGIILWKEKSRKNKKEIIKRSKEIK